MMSLSPKFVHDVFLFDDLFFKKVIFVDLLFVIFLKLKFGVLFLNYFFLRRKSSSREILFLFSKKKYTRV